MKTNYLLLCVCIAGLAGSASAQQEIKGKVIAVIDGNTIEVLHNNDQKEKFMLFGVDSPELTQDYGDKAKHFLEKLVLQKEVTVTINGKDRWGNALAIVIMKKGDVDLRIELLKEGLAWTAEKNPLPELELYRKLAQEKGYGLWKQANAIPPWIYRRQQSMLQPKSS
jgi:micrococcal nuclease